MHSDLRERNDMSKLRLVPDKNLTIITRKYFGKVPIQERELEILEGNAVVEFLHPRLEGRHRITYIAPASLALDEYMKADMTVYKLYSILIQIVEVVKIIEKYGLRMDNLVLDRKFIYVREMTGKLIFLYEPVKDSVKSADVYSFLSKLINDIHSENPEVQGECERLRAFFMDADCNIEDMERLIMNVYPSIYQQTTRLKTNHLQNVKEDATTLLQTPAEPDATVVLGETKAQAGLLRLKTSDKVEIEGSAFHIGKDITAEYCISDNNAISRNHAVIVYREGRYAIRDEQSTNYTYINGIRLDAGIERELQNGDCIQLADEEFQFYIR